MSERECAGCICFSKEQQGNWLVLKCSRFVVPGMSANSKSMPVAVEREPGCYEKGGE
jgi:hypothetical protein